MLLGVYYSLSQATSMVLWPSYTLNRFDTLSNRIYTVRNPLAGYVTTPLHSVVVKMTTTLEFLNHLDLLDSVSNYNNFVNMLHTVMTLN